MIPWDSLMMLGEIGNNRCFCCALYPLDIPQGNQVPSLIISCLRQPSQYNSLPLSSLRNVLNASFDDKLACPNIKSSGSFQIF